MPFTPLDNEHGAFGYAGGDSTGGVGVGVGYSPQGQEIHVYRNMSTVLPIRPGMPVTFSTLSTAGVGVVLSSVIGDKLFAGIALTSAGLNTDLTTVAGTTGLGAKGTDYCKVVTNGIFYGALLSSVAAAGDLVVNFNSTGTTASGTTYFGSLGVAPATAAGNYAVAGVCHTPATTGTTGYLTTVGPRGVVLIRPSLVASISTA